MLQLLLDLRFVDAVLGGGHQARLELVHDVHDGTHARIGRVDLGCTQPQRIDHGRRRLVVRLHRRRDRPVGGIVGCRLDPQSRTDLRLALLHARADGAQRLEGRNCRVVGEDACHLYLPRCYLQVCFTNG